MKIKSDKAIVYISFKVGLILKGLFALSEIFGGIVLIFLNPDRMNRLIDSISKNELYEDPQDLLMNYMVTYGHAFSISAQQFAVSYLLSHGIIKLVVILLLWKKKIWAYPLSIMLFIGFIFYQLIRYMSSHSIMLLILTVFDSIMIVLAVLEYKRIRNEKGTIV